MKSGIEIADGIPEQQHYFLPTQVDRNGDCIRAIQLTEVPHEHIVDQFVKRLSNGSLGEITLMCGDGSVCHVACTEAVRSCSSWAETARGMQMVVWRSSSATQHETYGWCCQKHMCVCL